MSAETPTSLSERDFEAAADRTLNAMARALDALEGDLEVELSMGILSIELPDGTTYVVNSHRAAKQIWMAAERTAWHFDLEGDVWRAKKSGDELWSTVAATLSKKLGRSVELSGREG